MHDSLMSDMGLIEFYLETARRKLEKNINGQLECSSIIRVCFENAFFFMNKF